ncbi:MAG TPA: XdhC family protein [Pyrinomonadaceae bacterium]|jgi:xanthine dehydrogenase accessory factor|nr:XdhC family protein [Pyrinomonadaceae bacterium]
MTDRDFFQQVERLRADEEPFVLATVVAYKSPQSAKPGSKAIIKADGEMIGWVGGGCVQPIVLREAKQALKSGRPKLLTISPDEPRDDWNGVKSYRMTCEGGGSLEIYLEPFLAKPQLLIIGRSPVAQTISQLGRLLDFKVIVADPEARSESFPDADLVLTDLNIVREHINGDSFVVVATMGNGDEEGLLAVAGTRPRYLGLVASAKKSQALFEYARTTGASDEDIATFKCPAGIDLGGETLPEIAVSVAAELVRVRRESVEQTVDGATAVDPICGMTVEIDNAKYKSVVNNETIYFCCLRCKETFDRPQITQIAR